MDSERMSGNNEAETLPCFLDKAFKKWENSLENTENILADFIDINFFEDLKSISRRSDVLLSFEKSFRNIDCTYRDKEDRKHKMLIEYLGINRLSVTKVDLPTAGYQERTHTSLETVINEFISHVNSLEGYFYELDQIDKYCTVVDPVNPTYKDDYRKILLDSRIWLHLQVTPEGTAEHLHLVGNIDGWQNKLQNGLANWDHHKDITDNIMRIFDLTQLPGPEAISSRPAQTELVCSICLSGDLGEKLVPQPLCPNALCGVYFHRPCLYQWLVACSGGRAPPLGVATGACPSCFHTVSCSNKDP